MARPTREDRFAAISCRTSAVIRPFAPTIAGRVGRTSRQPRIASSSGGRPRGVSWRRPFLPIRQAASLFRRHFTVPLMRRRRIFRQRRLYVCQQDLFRHRFCRERRAQRRRCSRWDRPIGAIRDFFARRRTMRRVRCYRTSDQFRCVSWGNSRERAYFVIISHSTPLPPSK